MPLTRLAMESEVTSLVGRLMALVGNYGVGADGYQRYLNAPIRDGLREMGYPVSDPIAVADADLAGLDNFAVRRLIEWAELYVLDQVARDWWRVAQAPPQGMTPEAMAAMELRVGRRINELRAIVRRPFTPFVLPISVGRIAAGSPSDPTTPATLAQVVPPWVLAPRSYWYYGSEPSAYWGWGEY
jgi:hypothetical protein